MASIAMWLFTRWFYLECTQLVGGLEHDWIMTFHFIYGMSSFPLTFIFFRGVAQPPTSQDCERSRIYRRCSSEKSNIIIAITSYANCHGFASENAIILLPCRQVPWWNVWLLLGLLFASSLLLGESPGHQWLHEGYGCVPWRFGEGSRSEDTNPILCAPILVHLQLQTQKLWFCVFSFEQSVELENHMVCGV
jgi:hypothetical protein